MPHTITFDLDTNLVRVVITGRDTIAEMGARFVAVTSDPHWKPGTNVLLDFSAVTELDMSTPESHTAADSYGAQGDILGEGKLAIVSDQDFVYGMGRMWSALVENSSSEIQMFRSLSDAEEWLAQERAPSGGAG